MSGYIPRQRACDRCGDPASIEFLGELLCGACAGSLGDLPAVLWAEGDPEHWAESA